jgi:hypothetical protein
MISPCPQLIELRRIHQVTSFIRTARPDCARINRGEPATALRLGSAVMIDSKAGHLKRFQCFGFFAGRPLARFVQETDRSVSYPQGENK